jgi:3-phenylpropionate/trans-cinnamate dioxygenase ferredoxin component
MSATARFVRVGRATDVPAGRPGVFLIEDRHIAVYRFADGWYAIDDICTHDGGPLADGDVEDGGIVVCPRHGARFSVRTGAALSFPAVTPVDTYPVLVEGDDLLVGLPD